MSDPATSPDLGELVERLGDAGLVQDILVAYLEALPERVEAVRAAPGADSLRAAHSLKSASALLGLSALAEACASLEAALRADPDTAPGHLVDAVVELAAEARTGVAGLVSSPRPT